MAKGRRTRTEVKVVNGAPALCVNGTPIPAVPYFWSACHHIQGEQAREKERRRLMAQMRDAGVHLHQSHPHAGWNAPGVYDPATAGPEAHSDTIEVMMQRLLEVDPEGYFIARLSTTPPWTWIARHRSELEVVANATDLHRQVSWASDLWLEGAGQTLDAFIRYCEAQPWADHLLAYHFDGPSGEWCPRSAMIGQYTDYSQPMHQWFRAWLRRRYNDDEQALRQAWNDRHVTFETAVVPSPQQQGNTTFFRFRDPRREMQTIDYFHAVRDRALHDIQALAAVAKKACQRRKVVGIFYGYEAAMFWSPALFFGENSTMSYDQATAQRSGHLGLSWAAELEDVDYIASPYDYLYRRAGGVGESQSLPYAVALRGKLFWSEDDTRTHTPPRTIWYGRTRDDQESVAVLRRNFASMMTHNASLWWMDQGGKYFATPAIQATIRDLARLAARLPELDRRPWGQVAVVLDENGPFYTQLENHYSWAEVYKQRLFGLARLGAPYRLHTLRDLELENLPDYRLWIFLESHAISRPARQLIAQRCQRDGNVLVWLHGAGLIDGDPSVEHMTELTGMRFLQRDTPWEHIVAISNWRHPVTQGLPRDTVYGTDRMSGPVFFVWDDQVTELGLGIYNNGANDTALAIREFGQGARGAGEAQRGPGDWASVFSSAPNLPAHLLRGLARYAGCHIYCDSGDQVHADRQFVSVHTAAGGPTTLHLPEPTTVWDVFARRKVEDDLTEFQVELPPTSTTLYHLGDRDLLADLKDC